MFQIEKPIAQAQACVVSKGVRKIEDIIKLFNEVTRTSGILIDIFFSILLASYVIDLL